MSRAHILFQNGLPVVKQLNGDIQYIGDPDTQDQWEINFLLTRKNHIN